MIVVLWVLAIMSVVVVVMLLAAVVLVLADTLEQEIDDAVMSQMEAWKVRL